MVRELLKRTLARAGRTTIGKNLVIAAVMRDPRLARFDGTAAWPASVAAFEDLAFLFTSSQLDHGIVSLQVDEAAHLYRLVNGLESPTVVEIGRYKGGSTFLLAAALRRGGGLWSYDVHRAVEAKFSLRGGELDRDLEAALERYGLADRVHLVVGDSATAAAPPQPPDLVFVDGDHSHEGVRRDWRRWSRLVRPGGHVLFHDAVDHGGFCTVSAGVVSLVAELERDESDAFERVPGAGAIAHFVRRHPSAS